MLPSSPLAAVFGNVQNSVEHRQVRNPHVATLHGQVRLNQFVLTLCEFHVPMLASSTQLV